ncbi:MAG: helicase-related protein, partial [Candidatus Hadarchaeales archaeon]
MEETQTTDFLGNPLLRKELLEEREYQVNIAKEAVRKNTLVVLPTALGKTIIAVLAAAHFLYSYRRMKVLVMAPTRPLVLQHRNTFLRLLRLRSSDVEVLTGKSPPTYRFRAWEGNARVYFATPQVVNNDHENGLKLDKFSFLVFDECHRARKNYAYTKVAQAYVSESPYPIILAMTASPGAERKKIEELCRALFIEHVEMRTEEDSDVQPYVGKIGLEWIRVPLPDSYKEIHRQIREMLEKRLASLSSMGVIKKHPRFIFRNDLLEAGERLRGMLASAPSAGRGRIFGAIFLQSSAMTLYHALELLESQGLHTFASFLERLKKSGKKSHRSLVKEMEKAGVFQKLDEKEEHPKIKILEAEVRQQFLANSSSKVIVFTQYRDTSSWIVERLRKLGIQAERFVGQADKEGEMGMSQDEQARLLEKFRAGEVRVLVATSIAEEGLDIPNVDLVVFYEPVPSEIRYIQRKGRTGRGKFGRVVILATENSLDTTYLMSSRKKVEKMKRMIKRLNMELSPIMRFGSPPSLEPMTPEELMEAEELPPPEMGREELEELEKLRTSE